MELAHLVPTGTPVDSTYGELQVRGRVLQENHMDEFTTAKQRKPGRNLRRIVALATVLVVVFIGYRCGLHRLPAALNSRLVSVVYMQTGDTVTKISPGDGEGLFVTPSISPNGDEAVFHGAVSGHSRIWRFTQWDGKTVALTGDDYAAVEPCYSWDGSRIVFAADRGVDQRRADMSKIANNLLKMGQMYLGGSPKVMNIYIMNSDGSDLRQLTTWKAVDVRPTFNPDGQHVLFMSTHKSGSRRKLNLYTVSVTGDEEPELVPNGERANRPWYSPDGEWIYFWREIGKRGTLCRMRSDGSEWHQLADDTGGLGSHGAFVDPGGDWLWYHSVPDAYNQIFKMPIDGGDPICVTPPGFEKEHVAHVTAARNGNITFDVLEVHKK